MAEDFGDDLTTICIPALGEKRNWNSVFQFIRKNRKVVCHPRYLEILCKCLLDSLLKYSCNDRDVIKLVLEIYNRWLEERFDSNDYYETGTCSCFKARRNYVLAPICNIRRKNCAHRDTMNAAIQAGDIKLATAVVKYGFSIPPSTSSCDCMWEVSRAFMNFSKLWQFFPDNFHRHASYEEAFDLLDVENGRMVSSNERGVHRVSCILMVLQAVMLKLKNDPSALNCVEAIRLFFISYPQPFVCKEEVEDFLKFLLLYEICDVGVKMVEIYGDMFYPENALFCPRSLKDLCRCTVRDSLFKQSGVLPNLIHSLELPLSLKAFLQGVP